MVKNFKVGDIVLYGERKSFVLELVDKRLSGGFGYQILLDPYLPDAVPSVKYQEGWVLSLDQLRHYVVAKW